VHSLAFLHSADGGGVSFGAWGYCAASSGCTRAALGYTWGSELVQGLTPLLVLVPIACGFTFLALVSLLPILLARGLRTYPSPAFSLFTLLASASALLAFVFVIALFATAHTRSEAANIAVSWGAMVSVMLPERMIDRC
jgi:hypothetical protein